jgi:hypothetical protein
VAIRPCGGILAPAAHTQDASAQSPSPAHAIIFQFFDEGL